MLGHSSEVPSPTGAPDEISEEEKNSFKLIKLAYSTIQSVFYTIFMWGTEQEPGQTLQDYLLNVKGYSMNKYKTCFDALQRQKMSEKNLEDTFDVTHLYKAILHACGKLDISSSVCQTENETRLEWLITIIKNFRNHVSHNKLGVTKEDLISQAAELMDLLEKALHVAGALYGRNQNEVQKKIDGVVKDIKNIRDQSLVPTDLNQYEVVVLNEKLKHVLKIEGGSELKERYKNISQINPVSFLGGVRMMLRVDNIFTQIEVESVGSRVKGTPVHCNEIIEFCRINSLSPGASSQPCPEVYLLEGPAGSGKTTWVKRLKADWSTSTGTMKGLDDFDLVLFMECRNPSLSSFSQLLSHLFPKTNVKYFKEGELQKFILAMKILLIVDGLDELNSSSEKLFLEILNLRSDNLVMFCTSRPEKLSYFETYVTSEYRTAHVKVTGIADSRKEEFILKYHTEMIKNGFSDQNSELLLHTIRKSGICSQRHYRLPLNLVILVWLLVDDPSRITLVKSSSDLYMETLNMMKKKLVERLAHNEATRGFDLSVWNKKITACLLTICCEALVSLCWDRIEKFLPESVEKIISFCTANSLPPREVLSAFLVVKIVDDKEKISIPHKHLHEFYASLWVEHCLFGENVPENNTTLQNLAAFLKKQDMDPLVQQDILSYARKRLGYSGTSQKPGAIRAILSDLHKSEPESLNLTKYQMMLVHLAGVMHASCQHRLEECTILEIVQLLKEGDLGLKDDNEWFELLDNVKNDVVVIKHVSAHMTRNMTITEDRIEAAVQILDNVKPAEIKLRITNKPENISKFKDLTEKIANCHCQLTLYFQFDFQYPSAMSMNDEYLKFLVTGCEVVEFSGYIRGETVSLIRRSTKLLNLATNCDEHAKSLMKFLCSEAHQQQWVGIGLHITPDVSSSSLCELPDVMIWLILSGVTDKSIARACEIAARLLPPDSMYVDIRLPHSSLTCEGLKELLRGLSEADIEIGHLTVPESIMLLEEEYQMLKKTAYTLFRCEFRRYSEDKMWESEFLLL